MNKQLLSETIETCNKVRESVNAFESLARESYIKKNAKFKSGDKVEFRQGGDKKTLFVSGVAIRGVNLDIRYVLVHPKKDGTPGGNYFSQYGAPESQLTLIERGE